MTLLNILDLQDFVSHRAFHKNTFPKHVLFSARKFYFAKFNWLKACKCRAGDICIGILVSFIVIKCISFFSFSDRYYYDADNFLIRVNLDSKEDTLYHYSAKHSGLVRVTSPDSTWTQYLYNADGLYAGVQHYSNNNVLLRGVEYKHIGPGEVKMIENSNHLKSILKYNIDGELAYIKKDGSPAYKFINDKAGNIAYYIDDLVKKYLVFLVMEL